MRLLRCMCSVMYLLSYKGVVLGMCCWNVLFVFYMFFVIAKCFIRCRCSFDHLF